MGHRPTDAEQCEGCRFFTTQVRELFYLHSRDVTYATFCRGPYDESVRYRDFMGWEMPCYSAEGSLDALFTGRPVFETYRTTARGVEAMDNSYRLLDLTAHGRRETWEDSPTGWLKGEHVMRSNGRATAQWPRLKAGYSDDLGTRKGDCNQSAKRSGHQERETAS